MKFWTHLDCIYRWTDLYKKEQKHLENLFNLTNEVKILWKTLMWIVIVKCRKNDFFCKKIEFLIEKFDFWWKFLNFPVTFNQDGCICLEIRDIDWEIREFSLMNRLISFKIAIRKTRKSNDSQKVTHFSGKICFLKKILSRKVQV